MSVKPAPSKVEDGPITAGKGLDALERFIIQNWAPPSRFGLWRNQVGVLCAPKASLVHFLDDNLKAGWMLDGGGAVITIDPPQDSLVTIRVESENKVWTAESKYNSKRWAWKVVPVGSALVNLGAAMKMPLPEGEARYLQSLREGKLKDVWDAFSAAHP